MATPNEHADLLDDHPDGPEIRRQVEYYFSDENLPTDTHLLQCCGGRENIPVSISRICGFKKMRAYKGKKLIIKALRKSTFLVVSEDGKHISRKVPLRGPCATDEGFFEDNEISYDPRTKSVHPVPVPSQQKKEIPHGMTKNMMKPTGFEPNYVPAPITPAEAEDELAMYDPDKSFVERIEIAIQRFKQKRKMHEMYGKVFGHWMKFGGVDNTPRMFGALDRSAMASMDAEQIARATATHTVQWDRANEKIWVVDFLGVGQAFMSSFLPDQYGFALNEIENACKVLRSFYNFLLYHNVCPEYKEELKQCRIFVDNAEKELPKVHAAGLALPGPFNCAASTMLGGSEANTYTGDREWALELKTKGVDLFDMGMMNEEARVTFMSGIAIMGSDEQEKLMHTKSMEVIHDENCTLEVISTTPPTDITREMYSMQNSIYASKLSLQPLGTMTCRSIQVSSMDQFDLPKDKYPDGCLPKADVNKEFIFWIEDYVLEECFVGMKMEARVLTLEGGMHVLDGVSEVLCSFYKWIPNELIMSHKGPKTVVVRNRLDDYLAAEDGKMQGKVDGEELKGDEKYADDDFDE